MMHIIWSNFSISCDIYFLIILFIKCVQVCWACFGGAETEAEAGRHSGAESRHDGWEEAGSLTGAVQAGASCWPAGRTHPGTPETGIGLLSLLFMFTGLVLSDRGGCERIKYWKSKPLSWDLFKNNWRGYKGSNI